MNTTLKLSLACGILLMALPTLAVARAATKSSAAHEQAIEACVSKAQTTVTTANADTGDLQKRYAIYVDCMMKAGFRP